MICKLFVFRHAETTDNSRDIFSGWRGRELTVKGLSQARQIAEQLAQDKIDCAFTSHLKRARRALQIVLDTHRAIPVFTDDPLIERCYPRGRLRPKDLDDLQKFTEATIFRHQREKA